MQKVCVQHVSMGYYNIPTQQKISLCFAGTVWFLHITKMKKKKVGTILPTHVGNMFPALTFFFLFCLEDIFCSLYRFVVSMNM